MRAVFINMTYFGGRIFLILFIYYKKYSEKIESEI